MNIEELAKDYFIKSVLEKNAINEKNFIVAFTQGFIQGNLRPAMEIKPIAFFKEHLISNTGLSDLICMQNRINKEQYNDLLEIFLTEQSVLNRTYKENSDVFQHWKNWIKVHLQINPLIQKYQTGRL
jgi:hypothetical protein